jgi:alpha-galactosidase
MKSKPNNYCSLVTLAFCLGLALTGQAQTKGVERQVLPASGTTLSVLENAAAALNRNWADELFSSAPTGRLPFSFVYGGKPSLELFTRWTREVKDETIGGGAIRRTLTLTDPETRLEVRAVCLIYLDTAGVDWTLYFTNKGDKDSPVIEQLKALDASIGAGTADSVVLHRLNGAPCQADDWMPFDQSIAKGQRIEFAATNGRSSNVSPWFTADWGGGGVITAIGWSGQWNASVRFESGRVHTQVGMENLHTLLHPGESIRSPRILQLRWEGGDVDRAYNFFRHTMFAHIMPRIDGQLVWPPIVHLSTSFYELNDSNEQNVLSHLESLRGLGFEMFWLDAYWTGPSGFPNSMGNYGFPMERVEPKDRFPSGLRAIADAVEPSPTRSRSLTPSSRTQSSLTLPSPMQQNAVIIRNQATTGAVITGAAPSPKQSSRSKPRRRIDRGSSHHLVVGEHGPQAVGSDDQHSLPAQTHP